MKVNEVLNKTTQFFKEKNFESPRLDAELVLAHALGVSRIDLYLKFDKPLSEIEIQRCRNVVKRRSLGEPVAYILGEKEFYGNKFVVSSDVLIPRPETEMIVEASADWHGRNIHQQEPKSISILDLGCGSGCIGLSLLKLLPNAKLFAVDKSSAARKITQTNAERLSLLDRCEFFQADASSEKFLEDFPNFENKIDILVSNPPYISRSDEKTQKSVVDFEPHLALFAEENGLKEIRIWSHWLPKLLSAKAIAVFEFGISQETSVYKFFDDLKIFNTIDIKKDLSGINRIIIGEKNG